MAATPVFPFTSDILTSCIAYTARCLYLMGTDQFLPSTYYWLHAIYTGKIWRAGVCSVWRSCTSPPAESPKTEGSPSYFGISCFNRHPRIGILAGQNSLNGRESGSLNKVPGFSHDIGKSQVWRKNVAVRKTEQLLSSPAQWHVIFQ